MIAPKPLPKRKRMTLIVGMSCSGGLVICSDTQETQGDQRVGVDKLVPFTAGDCQFVVAGSGHGELIDSFSPVLAKALAALGEDPSMEAVDSKIEHTLKGFYYSDVAVCPAPPEDKQIKLLIAVSLPERNACRMWVSENIRLRRIETFEVIGYAEALYVQSLKKLYKNSLSLAQGVLIGVNVLTLAEETSIYIKSPFSVAVVRGNSIAMEEKDYIEIIAERLRLYESHLNDLFLACADTAISPKSFEDLLGTVVGEIALLRKNHLDAAVERMLGIGLGKMVAPYAQIPPGTFIRGLADGRSEAIYDINAKRVLADTIHMQHGEVSGLPLDEEEKGAGSKR